MKNYTFHWEVRDILAQFEQAFNDIVIKRFDQQTRVAEDSIAVSMVYAPKSRVLFDLTQKNNHIKLPVVAITVGGISRDPKRVFNKLQGTEWMDTITPANSAWKYLLQPVPINITVNMSIIARFQQDVDQILANFIPYCDPYVVVSWKWPEIIPWANFEIRSVIKWGESVNIKYPTDISNTAAYRIEADTSFTIESWMFKNSPPDGKPIYIIETSFSELSALGSYEFMESLKTEDNTEVFYTSARPQFSLVQPFYTFLSNMPRKFTLFGDMLQYTNALYVSAVDFTMFDTTSSSPLSGGVVFVNNMSSTRFATDFPGFSGIKLPSSYWDKSEYNINATLSAATTGVFDVIAVNDAGYGILTKDTRRETTNPYPSGSDDWASYVEFQYPCINGIEVL